MFSKFLFLKKFFRKIFKNEWLLIILFLISTLIFSIWFLAFYPGILSQDAINQWVYLKNPFISNTVPYTHTLIVSALTYIWRSSAIVIIFQILVSAYLVSYLTILLIKNGANRFLAILAYLLFILSPAIGLYNVIIWKDVMFAQGLLLLMILWLRDFFTKGKHFNLTHLVFLAIILAYISTIRHNGNILIVIIPIIYLLSKIIHFKKWILFQSITIIIFLFIRLIIPYLLHIQPTDKYYFFLPQMLIMKAVASREEFNDHDKNVISKIADYNLFVKDYRCDQGLMVIYSKDYHREVFDDPFFRQEFNNLFRKILKPKNIKTILKDRSCLFYATIGGGKLRTFYYQASTQSNKYGLSVKPISQKLNTYLRILHNKIKLSFGRFFIWDAMVALICMMIIGIYAIFTKNLLLIGYIIPFLILTLILFLIQASKEYRFFYFIQYGSYFLIPLLTINYKKYLNKK